MTSRIPDELLSGFSEFVAARMGLHFPKERLNDLARGLGSAAGEFGFDDEEACAKWLMSSSLTREQIEILAGHLTVGETYFFREKKSFESLESEILPRLIDDRRKGGPHLRIWSAGCATGEEPYSIAILLSKLLPDLNSWNITVLATDINPRFLSKASKGVYREWSFRDTPGWVQGKYFKKKRGGYFEILPDIKAMVTFAYQNLAEDAYPSLVSNTNAMDIILCRNVLMYFTPDMQRKVIQNLYRCLVDRGWLIVSLGEISYDLFPQFKAVNYSGVTLYRKEPKECPVVEKSFPGYEQSRVEFHEPPVPLTFPAGLEGKPGPEIHFPGTTAEPSATETAEKGMTKSLAARYEEALEFYKQGCYDEAAEKIEPLLSEKGVNSKAMALLAATYANQGRLNDALAWSEKAVAADKLNPDRHYLRAIILQEQGKIERAMRSLRRSLYLDQDFALAHFTLGNILRKQGKLKEADKYFKNALSLLRGHKREEIVAASEGITAGRLIEIINSTSGRSNRYEKETAASS